MNFYARWLINFAVLFVASILATFGCAMIDYAKANCRCPMSEEWRTCLIIAACLLVLAAFSYPGIWQ